VAGDDMADKNRAQGKSKKAMTKKARLKKKKVKSWAKPEIKKWNLSADSMKRRPLKSWELAGSGGMMRLGEPFFFVLQKFYGKVLNIMP
jgi:hypothetical protein